MSFSGFYSTGIVTIIWFVAWVFLVYETPRKHPRISENEIRYIETNIALDDRPRIIPWLVFQGSTTIRTEIKIRHKYFGYLSLKLE